jgi:tetratricopeptide (TPR) repeat protein
LVTLHLQPARWSSIPTDPLGPEFCDLDAARSDQVSFERRLDEATHQYPRCAYLKVLSGEHKYDLGKQKAQYEEALPHYKQAFSDYSEAVKLQPGLAEAYFDMGRILDVMGDPDGALKPYQQAVKLSPGTPAYHNNLADLYFRREEYDKALAEYGVVANLPLSALLAAKIYRLQNKLDIAAAREEDAIDCLKQLDKCLTEPDEQRAEQTQDWVLDISPTQQVRLVGPTEKQCYAELELALTKFLQDDDTIAKETVPSTIGKSGRCHSRRKELTDILKWELRRLGSEVHELTNASDAFVARFFDASNPR